MRVEDPKVASFFVEEDKRHTFKVEMDSCNVLGAINFCKFFLPESLDICEDGCYSCYIGADMIMVPCSFDKKNGMRYLYKICLSLKRGTAKHLNNFTTKCLPPDLIAKRKNSVWAVAC